MIYSKKEHTSRLREERERERERDRERERQRGSTEGKTLFE